MERARVITEEWERSHFFRVRSDVGWCSVPVEGEEKSKK